MILYAEKLKESTARHTNFVTVTDNPVCKYSSYGMFSEYICSPKNITPVS